TSEPTKALPTLWSRCEPAAGGASPMRSKTSHHSAPRLKSRTSTRVSCGPRLTKILSAAERLRSRHGRLVKAEAGPHRVCGTPGRGRAYGAEYRERVGASVGDPGHDQRDRGGGAGSVRTSIAGRSPEPRDPS